MATKKKTRQISIVQESGAFTSFFKIFSGSKKEYDFEGLSALRKILSNEKARILHIIKIKNPGSIYELARILERDFKSVKYDVDLLYRFGFIDLVPESKGKRKKLKPVLAVDSITIEINV